jgi:mono/diheme cytochrome c family protein
MLAWASAGAAAQGGKQASVPRAKAVEVYTANCQLCHGPRGAGSALMKGLNFNGRVWKHGSRLADIAATITNGVPSTPMLPFRDRLTPAQIDALAALVRSYDTSLKPASAARKPGTD